MISERDSLLATPPNVRILYVRNLVHKSINSKHHDHDLTSADRAASEQASKGETVNIN